MTSIRLEVWDRLGAAGFGRKIATLDSLSDSARLQPVNGMGEGRASLPDTFDRADEILTTVPGVPANNVRSVIRAYLDGDVSGVDPPYAEWLPNQVIPPQDSESGRFEISGPGREAMVFDAVVNPFDWNGEQTFHSYWPDWIYGGRDIVGPVTTTWRPHIFRVWIDAGAVGTGEIIISLNGAGFLAAPVSPGDSAFDVEQSIELNTSVTSADVIGVGTFETPWQIEIQAPDGAWLVGTNLNTLTGGRIYSELVQYGRLFPTGWTISQVGATTIPHGPIYEWGADATGPAALPAECGPWIFFRGGEYLFPGVQTRRKVKPLGYYYLPPIYLYAQGGPAEVRVVIRDLNEGLIAFEAVSLVANTLTQTTGIYSGPGVISGGLIQIPEGVYEIVYRIGHISAGIPPVIWVGCPSMTEGFAPSTVGTIVGDLYDDWTTEHAASTFPISYWVHGDGGFYLALDFDDLLDSAGAPWQQTEKMTIKRGERFDKVLQKIVRLGYDWRIISAPVDGYYLLQIFNGGTMGVDYSSLDTPTVRGGRDVTKRAVRTWLNRTGALVEGAEQNFAFATDTGAQTSWGTSFRYNVELDFDEDSLAAAATEATADALRKTRSIVVNMIDLGIPTTPIPGKDYVPGDTVRILDPPLLPDEAERVWTILYAQADDELSWEVQFGNASFSGNA